MKLPSQQPEYLIGRHYTYPFWKYYSLIITTINFIATLYLLYKSELDLIVAFEYLSTYHYWIIYFINVFAVLGLLCTVGDIVDDSDPRIRKERKIDNL